MTLESRFNKAVEEQEIQKWSELEEGVIYEIIRFDQVSTIHGPAVKVVLEDDEYQYTVWAPKRLGEMLLQDTYTHVRPKGKRMSKSGNQYYDFDIADLD